MTAPLGFVGLGMMGAPMVRRLAGAGQALALFDTDGEKATALAVEVGAVAHTSLASLAAECDVVITMLPNSTIVRSVVLDGADSLGAAVRRDLVIVDMSSSDPLATRELGAALTQRSWTVLDAPVSGGVRKAVAGTLAIMLGGDDPVALDRVELLLAPIGTVVRTGPLGSGHAAKALNNYVSAVGLAAACEAIHVGRAFGLDPKTLVDVLNVSTGRNNSTENKLKQFVLNGAFRDAGFSLELMAKDVAIASALAEGLDLKMDGMSAARDLWSRAHQTLGHGADHTEVFKIVDGR
ncbi:NAD(P)-dependent oxidoreductase [Aureimonas altamirensis]|uniref:NAD(P)-dependent oxidoreductase n=1 Tax=Aureimonas altamirensis TaxID=370622 RepID=UPI002036687E|nr:NAD(P)-dependent oxidoreductase [Aureimonas altamirensis]MCM2502620.1 NAD(P)-dependent oxidoreductase [Aureimonas altamirensis]